jgi:hypothetical protein
MRKHWFIFGISLLLTVYWIFPATASDSKTPKMVLDEKVFDAKDIEEGKVIEHSFRIRNEGDAALELLKVAPG